VSSSEIELCQKCDEPGDRKTFMSALPPLRRSRGSPTVFRGILTNGNF
jgi:hypothetical protein